jgi:hypothetical protein
MGSGEVVFEVVKIALVVVAAAFTYIKFFREGTHKQRIEFDIELRDLGVVGVLRILEVGCTAENKGNIEHRFDEIRVTVRGLDGEVLKEFEGHEPRLKFPLEILRASLIPAKYKYFFVRPGVRQCFPLVVRVPAAHVHLHIRATFKYKTCRIRDVCVKAKVARPKKEIHSAERAFCLPVS